MTLFANDQLKSHKMTNSGSYWSDCLSDRLNETHFHCGTADSGAEHTARKSKIFLEFLVQIFLASLGIFKFL